MVEVPIARVDKLLSSMGYGSRREIALLAKARKIFLDDAMLLDVTKSIAITPNLSNRMQINNEPLDPLAGIVILMNKPIGMTCSHQESGPRVYDVLPDRWQRRSPPISTIGRLDKQTSGLLLLTDDGDLLHRIISPKRRVEKTYRAKLTHALNGNETDLFASGNFFLKSDPRPLAPAKLEVITETEVLLTVTEGRYHQVRRMFAAIGNHVDRLHRESVGGLTLRDSIPAGAWRLLSNEEIELLHSQAKNS